MMVVMVSCTASSPYTFLMKPGDTTIPGRIYRIKDQDSRINCGCSLVLTEPDVLAGPGHVVVEGEVLLQSVLRVTRPAGNSVLINMGIQFFLDRGTSIG